MRTVRKARVVFEDSTEVEKGTVYGSAFHGTAYIRRSDVRVELDWHSGLNVYYPKSMPLDKVRQLCGL